MKTLNSIVSEVSAIDGPYCLTNSLGQRFEISKDGVTRLDSNPNPIHAAAPTYGCFGGPIPRALRRNACHTMR